MDADYKLSANFWLSELIASGVSERRGISNVPDEKEISSLRRLCQVLEQVRAQLGRRSLLISSGFRCGEVNATVGGSRTSAHLDGRAADFTCPNFGSPHAVALVIANSPLMEQIDQLIYEGTWVHLGIPVFGEEPRQQVLTAVFQRGQPARYLKGVQ